METTKIRICGLDEAGRGALAGPLVAAAVIFPKKSMKTVTRRIGFRPRDGKTLSDKQRRKVYAALKRMRATIAVEVISARSINNHGIGWANREIFRRLIRKTEADQFIVDGRLKIGRVGKKQIKSVVNADATVPEVICAGIVAKVERDTFMNTLHRQFPKYKWKENAGYGTASHIEAIKIYSVTQYHRLIYVTTALKHKEVS